MRFPRTRLSADCKERAGDAGKEISIAPGIFLEGERTETGASLYFTGTPNRRDRLVKLLVQDQTIPA